MIVVVNNSKQQKHILETITKNQQLVLNFAILIVARVSSRVLNFAIFSKSRNLVLAKFSENVITRPATVSVVFCFFLCLITIFQRIDVHVIIAVFDLYLTHLSGVLTFSFVQVS